MKYHAFISYSHSDKAWAEWLHRRVETYRLPKELREEKEGLPERFFPVFRDRDELAGASVLGDRLREALRESEWLIVVCSPRAVRSEWVNEEVRYFKQLGRADRVLCLVVDGVPKASLKGTVDAELECFPETILHPVSDEGDVDNSVYEEPLAADARLEGDGKRAALLKIIAGMAEVGFGDLVRRDQRRAIERLRWVVAGVSALVLAFAGLGTALYFQKKEAIRQRDMAREVRDGAQELNTFIIVDLRSKLRDLGRLDLLEDVTTKVLNYHERLPPELADDPAVLRSRAIAMDYAGQQAMSRGDAAGAVSLLEQSQMAWLGLMARQDAGDDAMQGYAVSAKMQAEALARSGDRDGVVSACDTGLGVLKEWGGTDRNRRPRWCRLSAMLLTEKGQALRRMGRKEDALDSLDEAAALAKEAVEIAADDPKCWQQAAECFSELAVIFREENDLDAALNQSLSAVSAAETFAEFDMASATGWMVVAGCSAELFAVHAAMGNWSEAEATAKERLGWTSRLRGRDPLNPSLSGMEARARDDHGAALANLQRIEDALKEFQESINLLLDLVMQYPTDATWREDLAIVFRRRGNLAFDWEVWDVALEDYESSLRMRDSLIRLNPSDTRLQVQAVGVVLARAEVLQKTNRLDEALAALNDAEGRLVGIPETRRDQAFEDLSERLVRARTEWSGR